MGKGPGPEEQREDTVHQHTHKENKGERGAALCTHGTGNAMHVKRVEADGTHWQQSLGNRLEVVVPPSTDVRPPHVGKVVPGSQTRGHQYARGGAHHIPLGTRVGTVPCPGTGAQAGSSPRDELKWVW